MEENINLKLAWSIIKKRIVFIIISCIVFAVLMFVISKYFLTEQYTSGISLYVSNNVVSSSERIQSSDISASTLLARDCEVLFKEQSFLSDLSSRVDGRISPTALNSSVSVVAVQDTRIVKIKVSTPSAELSAEICNQISTLADEVVKSAIGSAASAKNIARTPTLPSKNPSSPNIIKNTILGAIIGAVLSVGLVLLSFILDNTVKDEDDLRMHIDVPVLGEIPCLQEKSVKGSRKND